MTTEATPNEEITSLKKVVEERFKKIEDVKARITRQEDHIDKTVKKKERFEDHLSRWLRQNDRDIKKIKELEKANDKV